MSALSVKNVSKIFPALNNKNQSVQALQDVSLEVNENEFVSILGHSGCGKTTLLNLIAGFEAPTSGSIFCAGKAVKDPGADRSMVFQDYALFPWLTVRDNIAFGLHLKRINSASIEQSVMHFANLVGLSAFGFTAGNGLCASYGIIGGGNSGGGTAWAIGYGTGVQSFGALRGILTNYGEG
ncbi:MAG: ATP-binding cassette domain-containing protein, partial [Burkholderiaceae bacterium]|nr:ATP-binding cassette domain-containing protein [Burkholderiaceae bacterium]